MITDIKQIIHFYTGQRAVIVSDPTNPEYKRVQNAVGYNKGESFVIRGVGITSCWLQRGQSTFPVPHEHLNLLLKPYLDGWPEDAEKFASLINEGYDVFNVIGRFAINSQKQLPEQITIHPDIERK